MIMEMSLNKRYNGAALTLFALMIATCSVLISFATIVREKRQGLRDDQVATFTLADGSEAIIEAFREFENDEKTMPIIEGHRAQIYCNLSWPGPHRELRVQWFKDDDVYIADQERNIDVTANLTIARINIPTVIIEKDVGKYKCAIYDGPSFQVSAFEYDVIEYYSPTFWTWLALAFLIIIILAIVCTLVFICVNRSR